MDPAHLGVSLMGAGRKAWLLPRPWSGGGGEGRDADLPLGNHNRDAIATRMVQAGGEGPAAILAEDELKLGGRPSAGPFLSPSRWLSSCFLTAQSPLKNAY